MTLEQFKQTVFDYIESNRYSGEDWDHGYAEAADYIFKNLEEILNQKDDPNEFDAESARKLVEQQKQKAVAEALSEIIEQIRLAASNGQRTVVLYAAKTISNGIKDKLEQRKFKCTLDPETPDEDSIWIEW